MAGGLATAGAGLLGVGAVAKGVSSIGSGGNSTVSKLGNGISNFGKKMSGSGSSTNALSKVGNSISTFGDKLKSSANSRMNPTDKSGVSIPTKSQNMNRFASRMMSSGKNNIQSAIDTIIPNSGMYRRRFRPRGDD